MTKSLHLQKNQKRNVITQKTQPKTSITQRLRTDLGRSVLVTVLQNPNLPTDHQSRVIKRTQM